VFILLLRFCKAYLKPETLLLQETLEKIGRKLVELRKQKGYTSHEAFAWDFDLPRGQYWQIERGKANITMKSLYKILLIHNLTLEEFFSNLKSNGSENKSTSV
jgi:transcriptional regulator with XRE-family HTH domain